MDGKIKKCKKDLQSLYQTMTNLKERNDKLKGSLKDKKTGELDKSKKFDLEQRLDRESKEMWEKKNELEKINSAIEDGTISLKEKESQINILRGNLEDFEINLDKIRKEVNKRKEQFDRSENKKNNTVNSAKVDLKNSDIGLEVELNNELLKFKFLKNAVLILCNEIPEMRTVLNSNLQEAGIEIGSRPISEKAPSEMSKKSIKSIK